jgi:hypothetical protein
LLSERPIMLHRASWVVLLFIVGCAGQEAPDCATATEHVSACYGQEVADAFAEACTPEAAATALDDDCGTVEEGKADSFSTPILSPAIEQFKYGSIGADKMGLPLALMRALPLACSDLLPAGTDPRNQPYAAFGLIYEAGHDLPIGFSTRALPIIGTKLVGNTCSVCHTSTVRETPTSSRTVYMGAPNIRFDLEGYNNFLFGCITDPSRFNATSLNRAFDQLGIYGLDRLLAYKTYLIRPFVEDLQAKVDSVVRDGPWGPGRDDAIGLSGATLLGPEYVPDIPTPVDFPAVWNQSQRRGHALHWDGAAATALERNVLVAVGAGTPANGVPLESIAAIQNWLDNLAPPRYPFAIDTTLTARGAEVFAAECASCHSATGARIWQVIPNTELGTDSARLDAVTQDAIDALNDLSGYGWAFNGFRKTDGYLASLLDGIWLRAPYLHNGSVPTLRALLTAPAERPATFYRGNDTYDKTDVGFVSNLATEGNARYMLFETTRGGNSNAGHDYGTWLPEADKAALIEYLKTL